MADQFWRGRSVLVTGAAGFVGSHVTRALVRAGADVTALVRDVHPQALRLNLADVEVQLRAVVTADLTSFEALRRIIAEYEVQTIMHLGAQAIVTTANRSPVSSFESNVRGTWQLLEAARGHATVDGVVVASSDKAYGTHAALPYREDFPLQPRYPYDVSKACADLIARSYAATFDMPVAVSRCSNIYGPGDLNFSRIIPDMVRSALRGGPLVIRGAGTSVREYLYVDDAVSSYLTLGERVDAEDVRGRAFNFGGGFAIATIDLVQKIMALTDRKDAPTILGQTSGEIAAQYLDSDLARETLGWAPETDLDEGLARTVAWYRASL